MRCGCPVCGTYMVQSEHGLESGCLCPNCANRCTACMGTEQPPLSVDELRRNYEELLESAREQGEHTGRNKNR